MYLIGGCQEFLKNTLHNYYNPLYNIELCRFRIFFLIFNKNHESRLLTFLLSGFILSAVTEKDLFFVQVQAKPIRWVQYIFGTMERILAAIFAVAASGASVDECSGSFFIYNSL
jgi:hypothetical protein